MREERQTVFRAANPLLPLEVRGLRFSKGGRTLIDGIDLTLSGTGITTIMGPNGAGKSLLLRLLNGLETPTDGHVTWSGRAPDQAVRRHQSLLFQTPVLLRRSVAANLNFVLPRRDRAAQRARLLELVRLSDKARQPARALSGGEAQRLALARALAIAPRVLLADEPTASLDPTSTALIERIIGDVAASGTSVIFVTHDAAQARRLGGDVVFLDRGRVIEHASAPDFFNHPNTPQARAYLAGRLLTSTD